MGVCELKLTGAFLQYEQNLCLGLITRYASPFVMLSQPLP
ncbi:hypothetical protein BFZC1_14703 [Lysinibacillus fusiformis ZC1]|nr:hypothetical protein BFZC1_14703 [Lysinibacillus fusiformis ZC1]EKU42923.1 hypothetical protein C518_1870 [Lysinibacillus fusiformis ZB2]